MRCSECGLEHNEKICPHCKKNAVLIPEIVEDSNGYTRINSQNSQSKQSQNGRMGDQGFFNTGGAFSHQYINIGQQNLKRFPTWIITFALALGILFEFGLLVLISFLVFMLIGKGVTLYLTMKNLMQGRKINPWIYDIAVWGISLLVVVALS